MPKPPRPYTITRHDPLRQVDDNLWEINGDVPGSPPTAGFHRRMSIVRLSDGKLLFHNAVPVDDATLAAIRALGKPAFLLAPHHLHAMDAHAFREKLDLACYTSPKSIDKVRQILPVAGSVAELPKDPAFSIFDLPSSKFGESGLVVKSGDRASLVVCDIIVNVPHGGGFPGLLFRAFGFTGPEPRLPVVVRMRAFPNKDAVRADLRRLADIPNLVRVVPSHGPIIESDPAAALRRIADRI